MNHIVIIGFMGSGKTRVGKRLAKDLGLPFIDAVSYTHLTLPTIA